MKKSIIMTSKDLQCAGLIGVCLVGGGAVFPYLTFVAKTNADKQIVHWSVFVLLLISLFILHELIHALFIGVLTRDFRSIALGADLKKGILTCHCKKPMACWKYRIVLVMPTVWIGILPLLFGFLLHDFTCVAVGSVVVAGSVGDLLMLWRIRNLRADATVYDHPDCPGIEYEQ